MRFTKFVVAALAAIVAPSALALNNSCTAGTHGKGVCVDTSECVMKDGQNGSASFYKGYCKNDPANVMCCVKTVKVSLFKKGKCLNVNDCTGEMKTGYCPGNSQVKLCMNA